MAIPLKSVRRRKRFGAENHPKRLGSEKSYKRVGVKYKKVVCSWEKVKLGRKVGGPREKVEGVLRKSGEKAVQGQNWENGLKRDKSGKTGRGG